MLFLLSENRLWWFWMFGSVWICKVLLLFQIKSNTDLGLKRHSCAFVTVLEEYSGPWRQGKLWRILIKLSTLIWFSLHWLLSVGLLIVLRTLIVLRLHRILVALVPYFLPLQIGWINLTRKLYSNAACSHKFCMLYQLLQYWGDLHLFLLVTLGLSRSPWARRARTLMAHHATQRWALATAVAGGISTVLPWSGQQANLNKLLEFQL